MILFTNDYNRGAHPAILEALSRENQNSFTGYGHDPWYDEARRLISAQLGGVEAQIHFLVGGTQVNELLISAGLKPWQSVLSADSGHIATHETGAIEHTGHKIETFPHHDGKITAAQVDKAASAWEDSPLNEHVTQPKMVYISQPTEFGTLYSLAELTALSRTCQEHDLLLMVDGARLGYGLGSPECDMTMADIARLVDMFTIGGTKCGLLFGEAAVITNPHAADGFRSLMKQGGALLAKSWLLGLQFATILTDDLYFKITAAAVAKAARIKEIFTSRGIPTYMDSPTNQQFIVLTTAQKDALASDFGFEYWERIDADHHCVRFCASWSTLDSEIDALEVAVKKMVHGEHKADSTNQAWRLPPKRP